MHPRDVIRRPLNYPPVWATGLAVLSLLLARILPIWRFDAGSLPLLPIAAGGGLALWALAHFLRKRTPFEPKQRPSALVVEGPYRISRNPMYLGMLLVLIGIWLWSGGLSGLLPVLAFPPLINRLFIEEEEAWLREAFGDDADDFLTHTRRWL